jgi:hypothetical protein
MLGRLPSVEHGWRVLDSNQRRLCRRFTVRSPNRLRPGGSSAGERHCPRICHGRLEAAVDGGGALASAGRVTPNSRCRLGYALWGGGGGQKRYQDGGDGEDQEHGRVAVGKTSPRSVRGGARRPASCGRLRRLRACRGVSMRLDWMPQQALCRRPRRGTGRRISAPTSHPASALPGRTARGSPPWSARCAAHGRAAPRRAARGHDRSSPARRGSSPFRVLAARRSAVGRGHRPAASAGWG